VVRSVGVNLYLPREYRMTRHSSLLFRAYGILPLFILALELGVSLAAHAQQVHELSSASQAAAPASQGFTFQRAKVYDSGGQLATTVVVSDVNGDGRPDLLVLNNNGESGSGDGSVGVLLGTANGSFRQAGIYDAGGVYSIGMAVGDVNSDGKPDLVVASWVCPGNSMCMGVLLGNGNGTFKPAVLYPLVGRQSFSGPGLFIPVMIADINGDGMPDLVAVSQTDQNYGDGLVGVLLGNGDGTFKPVVTYDTGGFSSFSAILQDLNGDGKPDVVVLNCGPHGSTDCSHNGTIGVLIGNGDGTFQEVKTYDSGGLGGTTALVVADVNGDGKPDILVGNSCPGNCTVNGSFGVLLGKGDGTFQPTVTYTLTGVGGVQDIVVADLNGDGKPDLTIVDSGIDTWLNKGDGTFQFTASYPTTGNTRQVLVTDLDGDGKLDFVDINITSGTADARLGNGDGTFQSLQTFNLGGSQISWGTIADVNGDGRPDLISANWCRPSCPSEEGSVGVLLNIALFPDSTSTTLVSSLNPSLYGQRVALTATVTNTGGIAPTGQVHFAYSGVTLGAATLDSDGVAILTRSSLNADLYPLTATYAGDANNLASTSAIVNQVVQKTTTTATLSSSLNPSTVGQSVTFKAQIKSPTVPAKGPVTFLAGKTLLGTGQLAAGKATLTTSSLPAGSTVVTVIYNGDSNIEGSSASVTQVVQP
jgi:hypothetical protein